MQLETLRLLAAHDGAGERSVEVELVAPAPRREHAAIEAALAPLCRPRLVDARPLPLPLAVLRAARRREPVTAARHRLGAVAREVVRAAAARAVDVVHAEQVQAMPQALAAGRPVLLRAQNVESELWRGAHPGVGGTERGLASARPTAGARGSLRHHEASRVERWEAAMLRRAALTLAVTERDAAALAALAPGARVEALPVPFPAELPAGPPLASEPAISLLAGAGWQPNREGAEAFVLRSWPLVRHSLPSARLHLFGDVRAAGEGVVRHAAPHDAGVAFAAGSILVVPLAVASGVRMKVLEAWARGVPVVATPAAAAGLDAAHGDELLIADMGEPLANALVTLARDAALRARLVRSARELLRRRHDPRALRARLLAGYAAAAATASGRDSR
ncbi:MAG TPA: glycosyltransferase [Thermoanaerobaculia bacterium]|nr:glycosyltransferase [Thermoanaerobaculia bacterium]